VKHSASGSLADGAFAYRRGGFSIIPMKPQDERTLVVWECYRSKAASDPEIQSWWTEWPPEAVAVIAQQAAQHRHELRRLGGVAGILLRAADGTSVQAERALDNAIGTGEDQEGS
jgi:hypothetical protein